MSLRFDVLLLVLSLVLSNARQTGNRSGRPPAAFGKKLRQEAFLKILMSDGSQAMKTPSRKSGRSVTLRENQGVADPNSTETALKERTHSVAISVFESSGILEDAITNLGFRSKIKGFSVFDDPFWARSWSTTGAVVTSVVIGTRARFRTEA